MAIPEDVREKLDHDPTRTVQHADIVDVMVETRPKKPWSRYMIQQHLDDDPVKNTVKDRLDELVELGVLKEYTYTNITLYDLAFDPIITDGGRLIDASLMELLTFRNYNDIRDIIKASFLMSLAFFLIGIVTQFTSFSTNYTLTQNIYIDVAILLYIFGFLLVASIFFNQKVEVLLRRL